MINLKTFEGLNAGNTPRYLCTTTSCPFSKYKVGLFSSNKCPECLQPVVPANPGEYQETTYNPNNNRDFSRSKVKETVWRVGDIRDYKQGGGIWFAETKEGAENFSISVRGRHEKAKPYKINLVNPYLYDRFWGGYLRDIGYGPSGRLSLMMDLVSKGHDGIIIDTDTWNDTGDEYSVESKQYVVFNPENIKPD
jgi:hypothetical protein